MSMNSLECLKRTVRADFGLFIVPLQILKHWRDLLGFTSLWTPVKRSYSSLIQRLSSATWSTTIVVSVVSCWRLVSWGPLLASWVAFNATENRLPYKIQVLTYLQPNVVVCCIFLSLFIMMRRRRPVHGDRLLLLVFHWLQAVSPPFECTLLFHHIHLGPAEQISNKQAVGLVGTEFDLHSRPEKVEATDDDEQNMGQGLNPKPEVVVGTKKKNKSFLSRLFRRK